MYLFCNKILTQKILIKKKGIATHPVSKKLVTVELSFRGHGTPVI